MSYSTHDETAPHDTSLKLLVTVWGSLVLLTWLTVTATYVDLGRYALLVALGIATVKATVVALFFMHLRWEKPFNAIVFLTAILFLGLFRPTPGASRMVSIMSSIRVCRFLSNLVTGLALRRKTGSGKVTIVRSAISCL